MRPRTPALALLLIVAGLLAAGESDAAVFDPAVFRDPPATYRSVPFWSLNDTLEPAEIDRQLRAFKAGGFGGSFLHSRIGLLTPYLGEDWFKAMAAGVKSSQELGLDAWFYDEDKWPSGFAGGIVPRQDAAFLARYLVRMRKDAVVTAPDTVLFEDGAHRYVCHVEPMGNAWFNGTGWVDLMNPAMVKAFIDCSYAPYAQKYGGQPLVRGMFTDEPQINPQRAHLKDHAGIVSFSPVIPAAFKVRTGQELAPLMPALFAEVGDWRRVRLDYYRTVAACFETAFSKQIGDWCAANNLVWTGHYNGEDGPTSNMLNEGNLMQQLRHMQQPGIDALGLRYQSVHCAKVMTSVANQYGRERRLSELFGISGHNMTCEDRMWITAWHTLMGVNVMCPHLTLYSMKGERKRDYPPTISPHQPYWRFNKRFEDYSARLCHFASVGRTEAEVCVLHPIESNFIEQASGRSGKRDGAYHALLNSLMGTHRNLDFGDEQIISEIAKVEGGRFIIGAMAYRAVIVPSLLTIRSGTLGLLQRFAAQGGTVLVAGAYPELVDGVADAAAIASLKAIAPIVPADGWRAALHAKVPPRFTLEGADAGRVWSHLRAVRGGHTLQLSNTARLEGRTLSLRVAAGVPVALWDPVDGRQLRLKPAADGTYAIAFAPAQTWIVSLGAVVGNVDPAGDHALPGTRRAVVTLDGPWQGKRVDPNAITLDYARFSQDGGATWSEPEPVLAFHDRCAGKKPWSGDLLLQYEVSITDRPAVCRLVVEQPEMYRAITVNGQPVSFTGSGQYVCHTFRTQDVAALLKTGANAIVLRLDYVAAKPASIEPWPRYGTEIESIYLVGDFAVQAVVADKPLTTTYRNQEGALEKKPIHSYQSFTLVKEGATFTGDLVPQGYPFYAGEFHLDGGFDLPVVEAGKAYRLAFPFFEAVVLGVTVNGQACPPLIASPWETDVSAALKPGRNTVRVALTNSLRNLLGPHHHKGGELTGVGPATFRCNQAWPNKEPGEWDWFDARRGGQAKLWRDDYYCIPFGLLAPPVLVRVGD